MPTPKETQATVLAWAQESSGPSQSELRVATSVHEDLLELLKATLTGAPVEKIREKAADVSISLYRLAGVLGADLDRRTATAMMIGVAKELVPENNSLDRVVLRAEMKLVIAKNMIADEFPVTRTLQEVTAVRVILEEVVARSGGNLTDEVDAKMAINRMRELRRDGAGPGYDDQPTAELSA